MKCHSWECREAAKFIGSCKEVDGRPPRNSWELGFWSRAEQHVSSFDDALERDGQFGPRCRLMCLVYIRCLFCEASGTSSIGCFVCDLHRFSMKLKWECETLENLVRVLQVRYENGLCTPPRRLRYRTNLFVIWVWYKEMMTYCCVIIYLEVCVQSELSPD